ncbi:MAG TPA: lysophospholipid acyltransferase family protein [Rhizomicrobium sp.]
MAKLRAGAIIAVFLLVTLILIPWQWLANLFHFPWRKTFPQAYHKFLCRLFGFRLRIIGAPLKNQGVLLLANHTSWIDILIFSAAAPISFVAKAEVARWPLFGTLARLQRSVFVERMRRAQTGEARDEIRERLLQGDALVLFPEGTSGDGNFVLPFKSALMGAAEATLEGGRRVPVQPVAAAYVRCHGMPMGRETRAFYAWFGDMGMVPHLWEALQAGPLDVTIQFFAPLSVEQMNRKQLALAAHGIVREGVALALAGCV